MALTRIIRSDWTRLALAGPLVWTARRAELAKSSVLPRLLKQLDVAFDELNGGTIRGKRMGPGGLRPLHAEMLWATVRDRRPRTVVETGVCNGLSSAIILDALEQNGEGRLFSIDLPEFSDPALNGAEFWGGKGGAVVPAGRSAGWLVPEARRRCWRLVLGRSRELLGPVLQKAGAVDIFIHDSEHSYENQMFEFRAGYEALASGGLLVATDINWSDAFDDFWRRIKGRGVRRAFVDHSCALVVKP